MFPLVFLFAWVVGTSEFIEHTEAVKADRAAVVQVQ